MKYCDYTDCTFPATVKVKSVHIPDKVRELCEEHAYSFYLAFGADIIIDWPDWESTRVIHGGKLKL